jgi:hypothetical protein
MGFIHWTRLIHGDLLGFCRNSCWFHGGVSQQFDWIFWKFPQWEIHYFWNRLREDDFGRYWMLCVMKLTAHDHNERCCFNLKAENILWVGQRNPAPPWMVETL